MKKYIHIIILLNFIFSYTEIPDLVTKVATTTGNWLKLETGARSVGMAGAQVAAASGLQPKAMKAALNSYSWAYKHHKLGKNRNTLTVVDFNLPSYKKRLWVIRDLIVLAEEGLVHPVILLLVENLR